MITRTSRLITSAATASSSLIETWTAGGIINGERALMIQAGKVVHFDPSDENNYGKIVGISNQAAVLNDPVQMTVNGIVSSPGWGLTPDGVYYAAANGMLTLTPPSSGISVIIGVALDSENLRIAFDDSVITI